MAAANYLLTKGANPNTLSEVSLRCNRKIVPQRNVKIVYKGGAHYSAMLFEEDVTYLQYAWQSLAVAVIIQRDLCSPFRACCVIDKYRI